MSPPQQLRQRTSNCSSLLIYRPQKDERLSWPSWLTYSGWFTHISGHPSATGRAQDSESTPTNVSISKTTQTCTQSYELPTYIIPAEDNGNRNQTIHMVCKFFFITACPCVNYYLFLTDNFSGPSRAISRVCVCFGVYVSVC